MRRIDVKDWRSPVAQQFSIQSLPRLMIYNPEGAIVKQGYDLSLLDDPTSPGGGDGGGGGASVGMVGIGILALVAIGLFALTKILGPKK
jgi:hypothetical protein